MPFFALLLSAVAQTPDASSGSAGTSAAPSALTLLQESDRSRGGLEDGITWSVEITSTEDGTTTSRSYLVKARGTDALAEATAPPRAKGELMLFNDRTLWFLKPGLRKPVSISARQKLSGEAANGDIASTNYARDYDGTVVGEEKVAGEDAYRLELKAKAGNVTYDRIRYWVSKARRLALKAEFLTVSGDCFKTATFEYSNSMILKGKKFDFVSAMTITDAMGSGAVSVIRFSAPKAEAHASSLFNVNNLVR
jgi:outer membrane lipoprotein-sorting protein